MPGPWNQRVARIAWALAGALAAWAPAQEPIGAYDSATQPGPHTFILKQQVRYVRLKDDPSPRDRQVDLLSLPTTLNYGLSKDWSMSLRLPLEQRWVESERSSDSGREFGLGDPALLAKWRIWRSDTSPLDTRRFALVGGVELPSGQDGYSSNSIDPILGAAFTQVRGRHGVNLDAFWKFTTDGNRYPLLAGEAEADLLRYDAAYMYRIHPAEYSGSTSGAWYLLAELNGYYETNGDHELLLAPGIMYEGENWVLEFSAPLPVLHSLGDRPETEFAVVLGVRFLF